MQKEEVRDGAWYVVETDVHHLSPDGVRVRLGAGLYRGRLRHDTVQIGERKFDLRMLQLKPHASGRARYLDLDARYSDFVLSAIRFAARWEQPNKGLPANSAPSAGSPHRGCQAVE